LNPSNLYGFATGKPSLFGVQKHLEFETTRNIMQNERGDMLRRIRLHVSPVGGFNPFENCSSN